MNEYFDSELLWLKKEKREKIQKIEGFLRKKLMEKIKKQKLRKANDAKEKKKMIEEHYEK